MNNHLTEFDVRVFKDQIITIHFDGFDGHVTLNFTGNHPAVIVVPAKNAPPIVTNMREPDSK